MANNASSKRFDTPTLSNMLRRWCFTVCSLMAYLPAISRFVKPDTMNNSSLCCLRVYPTVYFL